METLRFNEVTAKLNKMFNTGNDEAKDVLIGKLKLWVKQNRNTDDKGKKDAIQTFLTDNGVF